MIEATAWAWLICPKWENTMNSKNQAPWKKVKKSWILKNYQMPFQSALDSLAVFWPAKIKNTEQILNNSSKRQSKETNFWRKESWKRKELRLGVDRFLFYWRINIQTSVEQSKTITNISFLDADFIQPRFNSGVLDRIKNLPERPHLIFLLLPFWFLYSHQYLRLWWFQKIFFWFRIDFVV